MKHAEIENFFKGNKKIPSYDHLTANKAKRRQDELTKPIGSLGKLEEFAIWMAGWQKKLKPTMKNPYCLVFAGNHGISNRGVSAYPSEVTYQMVENFKKGGAAINQLCDLANIKLSVIPIDLDKPTRDFSEGKAMDENEVFSAMQLGFESVPPNCDLLVLGEMGISNTTSATAISCALFNEPVKLLTGIGTGLNKNQLSKKIEIIKSALKLHGKSFKDPISILSCYGGREIAAIAGSIISARLKSIPVLLDGFVCTAAASSLILFDKMILDHCRISHLSSEQGHEIVLRNLKMEPILDLKLRLGEGSGAAIASLILRAALATHNGMSTFTDAKVTTKIV
ncbi:nicotinate-nucleotide--dimethylbenzimidazole phosphoribosyltransferase [Alphaproteobacteria bacterium]|nr:nicotinate-nucleotide--dimethylbenzimidazole phosphoribosyltransferase [Alphaproteobacteria bacterium]